MAGKPSGAAPPQPRQEAVAGTDYVGDSVAPFWELNLSQHSSPSSRLVQGPQPAFISISVATGQVLGER